MLELRLDSEIKERIYDSTVATVYSEWVKRGLLSETTTILAKIPQPIVEPFLHSFTTHVHKEKGLFLDLIGEEVGVPDAPRKAFAASSDLLWALSLMIDDIEDGDLVRGGRESCWVKFGKEETLRSADTVLGSLLKYLHQRTGSDRVVDSCNRYIEIGLKSVAEHRAMDLSTPKGAITRNYEKRCDFHGTFQLAVMFEEILKGEKTVEMNQAVAGLRFLNRGGQLINDLKDFVGGDLYERSYSDIRNGLPTVPLVEMYESLPNNQLRILRQMFGRRKVTTEDRILLAEIIQSSRIIERILTRVEDCYGQAIDVLSQLLQQNKIKVYQDWAEYKLGFLKTFLV